LVGVLKFMKGRGGAAALSDKDMELLRELAADRSRSVPMRLRLVAWWEGYDVDSWLDQMVGRGDDESDALAPKEKDPNAKRPLWSASRIEVVEMIWGKGFATPGGQDHIPHLVKPLGLNPAMSVLDLGAGLGGAARLMVEEYGTWVTGLESDKVLSDAGMDRSILSGMSKQAPIGSFDPETFELSKRFDCIFSKECFYHIRDKHRLMLMILKGLKPRGQLLFTDYVIDPDAADETALQAWRQSEPVAPSPWTTLDYQQVFAELGMDVRITEDITALHKGLILDAWAQFADILKEKKADRNTLAEMFREAELWARRVAAFDRGLRVYRFYALKPPDPVV
jgi:cyclopropane fatty-acyl-phospholipid synthase-like methyltransferase